MTNFGTFSKPLEISRLEIFLNLIANKAVSKSVLERLGDLWGGFRTEGPGFQNLERVLAATRIRDPVGPALLRR